MESVGNTINLELTQNSIKDTYRIKSKDSSNPIVVEFSTVLLKEKMLHTVKTYNRGKTTAEKLNTGNLGLKFTNKPVYMSEILTNNSQKLFYLARTFQQQYK